MNAGGTYIHIYMKATCAHRYEEESRPQEENVDEDKFDIRGQMNMWHIRAARTAQTRGAQNAREGLSRSSACLLPSIGNTSSA